MLVISTILLKMKEFFKKIIFRYTKLGTPRYPYNIEPIQLATIIHSIDKLRESKSKIKIFEIGVARGMTSRFICEHIRRENINCEFYCIDTFSSFVEEDIKYEVENRGKSRNELIGFSYNSFEVWKKNFKDFEFVLPIQEDASKFEFSKIKDIDLVFLDVDLYKPTIAVLNNVLSYMSNNGIIMVDNVEENNEWDGAFEAFMEFTNNHKLSYKMIGKKCGVIEFKST